MDKELKDILLGIDKKLAELIHHLKAKKSKDVPEIIRKVSKVCQEIYILGVCHHLKIESYELKPEHKALITNFVKKIGPSDAPDVMDYFVNGENGYYKKQGFEIKLLLSQCDLVHKKMLQSKQTVKKIKAGELFK